MNPEQALKIIDGIEEVRGNLPEDGLLVEEALIDVKDALKKQVPKEPIWSYAYSEWFREKMKVAGKVDLIIKKAITTNRGRHNGEG